MPPGDPRSYRRAVKPSGKLLQSRKQGSRVDHDGQRLDQRNGWMPLHGGDKPDDGVARHKAVGVEYDHMVIAGAEPLDPVLDVAGFARRILRAVTIENARAELAAQLQTTFFLGDPGRRVGCIAE